LKIKYLKMHFEIIEIENLPLLCFRQLNYLSPKLIYYGSSCFAKTEL